VEGGIEEGWRVASLRLGDGFVWMSVIAKELHTHTKLAETGSVVVASLSRISDDARQWGV